MSKCIAKTKNGRKCQAQSLKGKVYCFTHEPSNGKVRALARRLGGKRRRVGHVGDVSKIPAQIRTLSDILLVLDYVLLEAMPLENSTQRGRLLVAICGAFINAVQIGEFESRLLTIESALNIEAGSQ